jgi:hypothetical protein
VVLMAPNIPVVGLNAPGAGGILDFAGIGRGVP